MNKLQPEEILHSLPEKYYVIDLKTKKILQSNDTLAQNTSLTCYRYLFNKELPCNNSDEGCICQQLIKNKKDAEFIIEKETEILKKFYKSKATLIKNNIVLATYIDVSEELISKKELKINTKRLERAEKLTKFGYWEFNIEERMMLSSQGARDIYGINEYRVPLVQIQKIPLPEYRMEMDRSLLDLIRHEKPYNIKFKIKRPNDGEIRHIHSIAEYRADKRMVFGVIHDITETNKTQLALEESENNLNLLFEHMNSAFAFHKLVTDLNGNPIDYIFKNVNSKFEKMIGLKREELINKSVLEVLPKTEKHWIERYGKVALTGEPIFFTEYAEGLGKYFEVSAYSPKEGYFAVVFNDVTDRIKSQNELEKAKEKAEQSDRLKSLFLANMSHEIRTPLNGIIGFSNFICQENNDPEQLELYNGIIKSCGQRLMSVIDDVIDISLIQSNQLRIDLQDFSINELLNELFILYREQKKEKLKNINLEVAYCEQNPPCIIHSDKGRIFQILRNLLDNAFKFTEEGEIKFGFSKADDNELYLYVKDTGIGIKNDKIKIIFEAFRQAEEGGTRKYEGTGLGLSIVTGIVEKLNGRIWVESEYGEGSVFYVALPLNKKLQSPIEQKEKPVKTVPKKNKSYNIVSFEDDLASAEFLKNIVLMLGHKIKNFADVNRGIDEIKTNKPDLVLMDVQLPIINGYEATRIIKEMYPDLPIIIQTAYAMRGDREKATESGADDYVSKPVGSEVLKEKINMLLS